MKIIYTAHVGFLPAIARYIYELEPLLLSREQMKRLFEWMSSHHAVSETLREFIEQKASVVPLPKGHLLLEAPRISEFVFFLESGYAMSYRYIKGRKHIESFHPGGALIISPKSFFDQVASQEWIELLEPSSVIHLSLINVTHMLAQFPEANVIARATMIRYSETCRERIFDLQYLTAIERYEKLDETFPTIRQLVPLEQIATYLGIAPQHLSRIRKI